LQESLAFTGDESGQRPGETLLGSHPIYVTGTPWGLRGAEKDPNREIPFYGFHLIKDGKVTLLGSDKDAHGARRDERESLLVERRHAGDCARVRDESRVNCQ